ncbi:MAG: hypothetical protein RLP44_20365 [Aggregatilineales bacterium]
MTDYMPHEAPAHSAQEIPASAPPKLIGRDPALKQIYGQLKQGNPVHIHGQPGVGKTALAATLSSAYAGQPGGVLWMNVDEPRLEELLVRVGRAYDITDITNSSNPIGMIGAVENTLRQHKPLIVIDGDISEDVATRFITRCATGLPTMLVSENKLEGPWGALELPPLTIEDALMLFKQEARITDASLDASITALTLQLNNLPLGIVVAAKAMLASKQQPADYNTILGQVATATGATGPVIAIAASFRGLTNALQGVLLLMGATFDGRASADMLSMISGAPVENITQAMNIITQLRLVETIQRSGEPYYVLHTITHRFLQTWLKTSNRLETLEAKVRDTIVAYSEKYKLDQNSYNKLAIEMDAFLAAAHWAKENDQPDLISQLIANLNDADDFVTDTGYTYELMALRDLTSGSTSAFPGHPSSGVSISDDLQSPEDFLDDFILSDDDDDDFNEDDFDDEDFDDEDDFEEDDLEDEIDFGDDDDEEVISENRPLQIFSDLDDESEPVVIPAPPATIDLTTTDITQLRSTLAQLKQSGDLNRQPDVLKAIGQQQVSRGMNNEAIATYTDLLNVFEELDNKRGVVETIDMLSALMVKNENSQAAIMQASRGARLAQEMNDATTQMHLLTTLGDARQQLGESDAAINDYTGALAISREMGDTQNEAIILYKLGYAQLDGSDPETAIETWEQALQLFKTQGKRGYEGQTMGALGSAYGDLDRWSESLSFHNSALYIAREVGDRDEEAQQLASLGYAAVQANDLGQAVLRYRQALHLALEDDNTDDIVSNIVDLTRLLAESRKHLLIAQVLIDKASAHDPTDPDVLKLTERISSEITLAEAYQTNMLAVNGTVEDYAANAYSLLDA